MRRPFMAFRAFVVIVVLAVGAAEFVHSSAVAGRPSYGPTRQAPVVSSELVCPYTISGTFGNVGDRTWLGVGVPWQKPSGTPTTGAVTYGSVTGRRAKTPGRMRTVLAGRGRAVFRIDVDKGAVEVVGRGLSAPGLGAVQVTRRNDGPFRGIDGVACTAPGGSAWAVGASTTVGRHSTVMLTNVDDVPAVVDIHLDGTRGPIIAPRGLGISVPPHTRASVPLADIAPAERLLLVHVVTTSGRVAVAVRRQEQVAATPKGVDFLPVVDGPSKHSVVPGVFGGGGPRTVVLANPGSLDATATIHLVTRDSEFVPRGMATITVPAGEVVSVDTTKAQDRSPAAVVVTADQPLVTGAEMSSGPHVSGIAETAWSAATPPLDGPAVVAVNDVVYHGSYVFLSAPDGTAHVAFRTLRGVGAAGVRTSTVAIPAGHTVVVSLARLAGSRPYVAIELVPGAGGPVYAAREFFESGARGPLYTVTPLRSAPLAVDVIPAVGDVRVAVRP